MKLLLLISLLLVAACGHQEIPASPPAPTPIVIPTSFPTPSEDYCASIGKDYICRFICSCGTR